jgi:hypothetical protein
MYNYGQAPQAGAADELDWLRNFYLQYGQQNAQPTAQPTGQPAQGGMPMGGILGNLGGGQGGMPMGGAIDVLKQQGVPMGGLMSLLNGGQGGGMGQMSLFKR